MLTYFTNVITDLIYGYVEIKCVNKKCNRTFKFCRNDLSKFNSNNYCCNMGCALESYNQHNSNNIKESNN